MTHGHGLLIIPLSNYKLDHINFSPSSIRLDFIHTLIDEETIECELEQLSVKGRYLSTADVAANNAHRSHAWLVEYFDNDCMYNGHVCYCIYITESELKLVYITAITDEKLSEIKMVLFLSFFIRYC